MLYMLCPETRAVRCISVTSDECGCYLPWIAHRHWRSLPCPVQQRFAVTRFLMKSFRTSNTKIIAECQHYFGFSLPSKLIDRKRNKFVNDYQNVSLLITLKTCYGYDLIVCICRNLLPVYLFIFQLYLLFLLLPCLWWIKLPKVTHFSVQYITTQYSFNGINDKYALFKGYDIRVCQ